MAILLCVHIWNSKRTKHCELFQGVFYHLSVSIRLSYMKFFSIFNKGAKLYSGARYVALWASCLCIHILISVFLILNDIPLNSSKVQTKYAILLSSSKGKYVKPHSDILYSVGLDVEFACKAGGTNRN